MITKPPPWRRAAVCTRGNQDLTRLSGALAQKGWTVSHFSQEEAFIRDHYHWPYGAVFVFLPGAAGQELAIRARQAAPDCLVVWGSDDPDFARAAFRIRATDFFRYPCSWERIDEALQKCEEMQNKV